MFLLSLHTIYKEFFPLNSLTFLDITLILKTLYCLYNVKRRESPPFHNNYITILISSYTTVRLLPHKLHRYILLCPYNLLQALP